MDDEDRCTTQECAFGQHNECQDIDGNCCDCNCHLDLPKLPQDAEQALIDCTELSWEQMAEVVSALWLETKRRNPIGVNAYHDAFQITMAALYEIGAAEKENPTCDVGPTKGA